MKRKFCFIMLASVLLTGLTFCEKDVTLPENWNDPPIVSSPKDTVPLNPNLNLTYDSVKDIDGNVYKTIKLGSQVWMAENLRTTRYNDGNKIFKGYGAPAGYTDWFDLRIGAYVWWDNGESSSWGALYNWFAVGNNNLCPSGWHVPSRLEWKTLVHYLGGEKAAPGKLLISGTNESGFNAFITGDLCGWGFCPGSCIFWTSTDYGSSFPYGYCVSFCVSGVITDCSEPQSYGFNVRCMKDN